MTNPSAAPPSVDVVWARWALRLAWLVGLVAVGAQLAEIPWRSALRGYDNTFNYLWLRSLLVDGDWDFANDVMECDTLTEDSRELARVLQPTPRGRLPNKYGIGWAVLSAPAALAADGLVALGNAVGLWQLPRDGFGPVYQILVQLWHVGLAILALALARRTLRRWMSAEIATLGVVAIWLGSPLVYYQTSNVGMSHGAVFLAVAVAVYGVVRGLEEPDKRWPWLLTGAALGLAVITRYQAVVFGTLALAGLVARCRATGLRGLSVVGWLVLGAAPLLAVQSFAWHVVYGDWIVFSYGAENEGFTWLRPELAGVLFSPWHGLFYWHPLLLPAFVGLGWWTWATWRGANARKGGERPALGGQLLLAMAFLVAAGATIYVNAAWWCWWFAASFGSRAFDGALLGLMAGFGFLLARTRIGVRRVVLWGATALVVWNLYVFVLYRTATISRNEPVTWGEMLTAAPGLLSQLAFE